MTPLPAKDDGAVSARHCLKCTEKHLKTVAMALSYDIAGDVYRVYFLEADGMTALPWSSKSRTAISLPHRQGQLSADSAERQLERALLSTRRGVVRLRLRTPEAILS